MLRDQGGGLWIGTASRGLLHTHAGRTDAFTRLDGLSSDTVTAVMEDREGSVWVATLGGLDRFRDPAVTTFSRSQGLSGPGVHAVLAASDGSVWCTGSNGLNRWMHGRMTIPRTGGATRDGRIDGVVHSLFEDSRRRIWISHQRGIGHLESERFTGIAGIPGGVVRAMAEGEGGTLWMANQDAGLIALAASGAVAQVPWPKLGHEDFATALVADHERGGLWLGFYRGGIAYVHDGIVRAAYGVDDGLAAGFVATLRVDSDGALWVAAEGGLSRVKDGRLATLTSKHGLPCDGVQWTMEDDTQALWLNTSCGLLRIARSDYDAWAGNPHAARIRATVFDLSDGVGSAHVRAGTSPVVSRAPDGRVWFLMPEGLVVLDPHRVPENALPPPVHIEQVIADRRTYGPGLPDAGPLRLPPLVRDLQIEYAALSLAAPEKIRFRYKLEGRDADWQDPGARRQAFYNDLPPGRYRFRMTASNNSGVWNEAGTFVDFTIAPAYYQAAWFRASCLAAMLALVAGTYRLRLKYATRQVRMRLEARLEERERIARDLHDTLLQGTQGLILKVAAAIKGVPAGDPARRAIEDTLDGAEALLSEGRDRVRSLRTGTALGDLSAALERVASEASPGGATRFRSVVEGRPRVLDPIVTEEAFTIGREALVNALTHSGAAQVEMEIAYDSRQLRLRIRDDGCGIDPAILAGGGRAGHWGIQGMRERALRIGARFEIWSRPGAGTEVELTVPAATAYRDVGAKVMTSRPAGLPGGS
jgi:signal transduction histidine kinase